MIQVVIVIALAAFAISYLWRVRSLPPHKQRAGYVKFYIGLAVVTVIFLTATGRMHWLGAAITGAFVFLRQVLPWVLRALPFLNKLRQQQSTHQGQSAIQTDHLSATLDHTSGLIEGEIIEGPHKGWLLSELSMNELEILLEHYQTADEESAELLQAYIHQRTEKANEAEEKRSETQREAAVDSSRAEALATLGLSEGATEDEIVAAHRSLIQKLHPDRGGNDFLAAKINQAKDVLLKD
ncbi:MAG: molecular chaperone DnaJ [Gammaproteobacteria bacterium]|nr:molecular chaperone DnaJ [Luminiphilus sp.]NCG06496.1 molecular chaperone DnaJ [Gammaproteobacteria bacterium]